MRKSIYEMMFHGVHIDLFHSHYLSFHLSDGLSSLYQIKYLTTYDLSSEKLVENKNVP